MALTRLGANQSINLATNTTGTLGVANGGTGLTSGTSGQFLKFTGSTTLASAADNGKVLKVQQFDSSVDTTSTSSSFSTFKTNSFTPTSASSTIYFFLNYNYQLYGNGSSSNADGKINITSEATGSSVVICQDAFTMVSIGNSNTFYQEMAGSMSGSQASQGTSAFDITLRLATRGTGRIRVFDSSGDNDKPTMLTVMEVAA